MKLTAGDAPAGNDPRLFAYLEMQTETRSLLGLLLWVSLAYPQISHCVNNACGFMSNPSHEVNAYAKHIALHLYQYAVKFPRIKKAVPASDRVGGSVAAGR